MDEPGVVLFRHEYAEPEPFPKQWPGEWLALDDVAAAGIAERVAPPRAGSAAARRAAAAGRPAGRRRSSASATGPTTGTRASLSWGAGGAPNGLARDLRPDESLIPTFTSAPLDEPLDVVGFAAAELAWESSAPVATAVVRLMDVAPDGTSAQVTAGILNLTHRDSHASPTAARAGRGPSASASRCGRPPTGSCPGIASASASRRRTGR